MGAILFITGIMLLLAACLYAWLIGLFTFGWYRKKSFIPEASLKPEIKVSVIVAARNEEKYIEGLLDDLAGQDYPSSVFEVLVVDDHSTDKTAELVAKYLDDPGLSGFILVDLAKVSATDGLTRQPYAKHHDHGGKKTAIEAGISKAKGDVILLTDADCRVGPAWISSMANYFEDEKKMMVFGPVANFPGKGLLNRFQSLEFSGLIASGAGAAMAGKPFMCNGANLAYRKEAFLMVNGFQGNERFISGDDVFLMHKIKERFGNGAIGFALNRKAIVRTFPAPGIRAFINQRIRWASKTKGYHDFVAILTASAIFIFNLFIVATFFAGFFFPALFPLYFSGIILKCIIDFPLIYGITGFNKERRLMWWYLPFQLIYPVYIMIAGIASLFGKEKW